MCLLWNFKHCTICFCSWQHAQTRSPGIVLTKQITIVKENVFRSEQHVNTVCFTMEFMFLQVFEQIEQSMPKRMPRIMIFYKNKNQPWAHQGRSRFFDVDLGRRTICKNWSSEQPGVSRRTSMHGFRGSGVPGWRQSIKRIDESMIKTTRREIWHAVGPLASRISVLLKKENLLQASLLL